MNDPIETILDLGRDAYAVVVVAALLSVTWPYYAFHLLGWGVSGVMARVNYSGNGNSWRRR